MSLIFICIYRKSRTPGNTEASGLQFKFRTTLMYCRSVRLDSTWGTSIAESHIIYYRLAWGPICSFFKSFALVLVLLPM